MKTNLDYASKQLATIEGALLAGNPGEALAAARRLADVIGRLKAAQFEASILVANMADDLKGYSDETDEDFADLVGLIGEAPTDEVAVEIDESIQAEVLALEARAMGVEVVRNAGGTSELVIAGEMQAIFPGDEDEGTGYGSVPTQEELHEER